MMLSSTSCSTINTHVFEQADKKSTGVLCIGMENSRYGACPGAQIDATRMHNILKKYSDNATLLISQQATKAVVVQKMVEVCQKDLAIIFYSGHGGDQKQSAATKLNWPEPTCKDQFLCLYDAPMIDDEIWNVICGAKGRVVLICDCCHSATMFRTAVFSRRAKLLKAGKDSSSVQMLCWSGCPDNTYSYGSEDGGQLTNALLKYFDAALTYKQLWSKVKSDKQLKQFEDVQETVIGSDFRELQVFK